VREVLDPSLGLTVPRGDRAALVARVEALLADEGRRAELGPRCRAWVVERFSEDGVLERLRTVYAEVIGAAPEGRAA
jgi:glycosyltransferase involved in cell wall biosynthesis